MNKAIFLDRDGVINKEVNYLYKIDDFELLPNVIKGLKKFSRAGYKLIIVTNQSGIGRKFFSENDYQNLMDHIKKELVSDGIIIDGEFYCPHHPDEGCVCRKPNPALLFEAAKKFNLDLGKCYKIGDMTRDIEMGKRAGCKTIMVLTGKMGKDGQHNVEADYVAKDLKEAADWVTANESKN